MTSINVGRMGRGVTRSRGRAPLVALVLLAVLAGCASPFPGAAAAGRGAAPTATASPGKPTANLTPTPDPRLAVANNFIAHMTLDQELGQLFLITVTYPNFTSDLQRMLGPMNAGGVILYQSGIYTIPQTQALTSAMQHAAAIPLIIGADEEGDGDPQIEQIFGSHLTAWQIGSTGDPNVATREATSIAQQLKELGLNTDFAPVVDVLAPGWNWTRAFGRTPDLVSRMGAAEVDALQGQGVIATLKHFPGLGSMNCNPHFCLPVINSSRPYIEQNDLAPYRTLLSHHPGMIMTTDLLMPALDSKVAELSYPIVTGILRKEIGYDGVVVTDALYMAGVTQTYSMAQAGVLAIAAGNDMLEGPSTVSEMQDMEDALRQAVASGQISKSRIDESVRRILLLKMQYGLFHYPLPPGMRRAGLPTEGALSAIPAPALAGDAALVPDARRGLPAVAA
jgi:beta-N-acetylhexosaminidase